MLFKPGPRRILRKIKKVMYSDFNSNQNQINNILSKAAFYQKYPHYSDQTHINYLYKAEYLTDEPTATVRGYFSLTAKGLRHVSLRYWLDDQHFTLFSGLVLIVLSFVSSLLIDFALPSFTQRNQPISQYTATSTAHITSNTAITVSPPASNDTNSPNTETNITK